MKQHCKKKNHSEKFYFETCMHFYELSSRFTYLIIIKTNKLNRYETTHAKNYSYLVIS